MEQLLQEVLGAKMMSLLDKFSGYNQVLVAEEDQHKIAFTTIWGTFAYKRMPFGLINAGVIFQRAMDTSLNDLIGRTVVVYLDNLTVFSAHIQDHIQHLRQFF